LEKTFALEKLATDARDPWRGQENVVIMLSARSYRSQSDQQRGQRLHYSRLREPVLRHLIVPSNLIEDGRGLNA